MKKRLLWCLFILFLGTLLAITGSQVTYTLGTTPGNPASGKVRLWANSATGFIECLSASGTNCFGSIVGPASAVDTSLVIYSGTTGRLAAAGSGCTVASGILTCTGFASSDTTHSGVDLYNGLTSGTVGIGVADVAGTAIVYVLPSTNGAANQVMSDSGSTTCPTYLAGAPSTCHQLVWISRSLSCQPGIGDGTNAITAATYLQSTCWNKTGSTWTLTSIQCFTDNAGSSTLNATNGSATALLTGAVTCSSTIASGTQSGTTTIANNDFIKFTFVADGTSKQSTWVVAGTY